MTKPRDELKWFGEGFDGFPKNLPDDFVEYTLHIVNSNFSQLEKREELGKVKSAALEFTSSLTKGFIWQREGFTLKIDREANPPCLRGRTNFGDSVEDEWLIVYILRELSKKFPQIWIQVHDTDGQFLLIEAAAALPRWLNPEVADFRVWMNKGKLLIIDHERPRGDDHQARGDRGSLSLKEALAELEHRPSDLIDSSPIQAEAFYRVEKYPSQISNSLHHAPIIIPRKLAYILQQDPAYVSPAIEAFYLRDPIALRPLRINDPSKLEFPPKDLVRVSAKFTKVGYAQLKSQQFNCPKAWTSATTPGGDLESQEEVILGMKVSCGFEMLMSDPHNQDKNAVREITILLEDIQADPGLLPSDTTIRGWGMRKDDETWLDINFEDFEKELGGNGGQSTTDGGKEFAARGDLRNMVGRFEKFLNDETEGAEGAEYFDDMDNDNDDDDDSQIEDEIYDEDRPSDMEQDINFNADEFASMMKGLMGIPRSPTDSVPILARDAYTDSKSSQKYPRNTVQLPAKMPNLPMNNEAGDKVLLESRERDGIREDMYIMERELREAGVLDLDSAQDSSQSVLPPQAHRSDGGEEGDVNVDFTLAQNLLESFKI